MMTSEFMWDIVMNMSIGLFVCLSVCEYACMCVFVCVCLSASIFQEPNFETSLKFSFLLWMMMHSFPHSAFYMVQTMQIGHIWFIGRGEVELHQEWMSIL